MVSIFFNIQLAEPHPWTEVKKVAKKNMEHRT